MAAPPARWATIEGWANQDHELGEGRHKGSTYVARPGGILSKMRIIITSRLVWIRFGLLTVAMLTLAACGNDSPTAERDSSTANGASSSSEGAAPTTVLATTGIWADVVGNVACAGTIEVDTIIPTDRDPHSFELSIANREQMDSAALIVANGLGLEAGLNESIEAVESSGVPVFFVADHLSTLSLDGSAAAHDDHNDEKVEGEEMDHADEEGHDHEDGHDHADEEGHDHADGHDHGGADPHVWFDPVRVSDMLPELGDVIAAATGIDQAETDGCVAAYQEQLMAVDTDIADIVDSVAPENRRLVTNHDGFGYFADRYNFEIVGTVIPSNSTLAEANPAQLEELAAAMAAQNVGAIFTEYQGSSQEAEALARLAGDVDVVPLYVGTLGPPESGADSYIGLLRTDATRIADALSS